MTLQTYGASFLSLHSSRARRNASAAALKLRAAVILLQSEAAKASAMVHAPQNAVPSTGLPVLLRLSSVSSFLARPEMA